MDFNNSKKTNNKPAINLNSLALGKVPPQAREMEEAVLGGCLIVDSCFDTVAELLKAEYFYTDYSQKIFAAMAELRGKGVTIEMLSVIEQLQKNGHLEDVGGPFKIAQLTRDVVSTANILPWAETVRIKYMMRELGKLGGEVHVMSYDASIEVEELTEHLEKNLTLITSGNDKKTYEHISTGLMRSLNRIDELKALGQSITGVPSTFNHLDKITAGWQPTDLIILAARPAVGKTAFALNLARNAALNQIKPVKVGFFSLEMSAKQLVDRILSAESEVFLEKISRGTVTAYDDKELLSASMRLDKAGIFIDDTPGLTVFELRSRARRLKRKEDVGMIIIDYLQLMSGDGRQNNREQEISKISRELKALAKELGIPIIALSQLSRATETRTGDKKMPQLSDLRESGAIEQDADMVMFMYRPEYYDVNNNENGESTKGETHIKIAKHRNGELATVILYANLAIQKFSDVGVVNVSPAELPSSWVPVRNLTFKEDDPF